MNRLSIVTVFASLMIATVAPSCSDGVKSDPVELGCNRLDECNALGAGISAQECVEETDAFLEDLSASKQSDWDGLMRSCLNFSSCELFIDCVIDSGL